MEDILRISNIEKYYGNGGNLTKALSDVSFQVHEGEFIGIMGASGSGKTTLLNCISTIDTVSAGHIFLDGTDVTEIREKDIARFRRENLGFIFQEFNLLDTLTIRENGWRIWRISWASGIFLTNSPIRYQGDRSSAAPVPEP